MKKSILVFVVVLFIYVGSTQALTMDYVTVDNANGVLVDYVYKMGKYEVTAGQYTEFLNAVADTDTYDLYNPSMWSSSYGCKIQQSGSSGGYSYSVASDWANRPVNYVGWYDTLRFSNWLGTGDTEDGAYDMSLGSNVVRKAGAAVWLPDEDEWHKSGHWSDSGAVPTYWMYPTSADYPPSNDLIDPDPGNNANFYENGYTIGAPYYRTEVGEFENSPGPNGTFDQAGNVREWTEEVYYADNTKRTIFDGSFQAYFLGRTGNYPAFEYYDIGFRVATVPEPGMVLLLGLGAFVIRKKRG
jgi:formylglycine-generating enzyme required for sulfatase activity